MTNPSAPKTRVVKVGGSLLCQPKLPQRLQHFLETSPADRNVIVAGGGALVDTVRQWHEIYPVSEAWCHRCSLRLMNQTAMLLSEIGGAIPLVSRISDIPKLGNVILDCEHDILASQKLEATWNLTSDSIAAHVANQLEADELWLLKSCLPGSSNIREWAKEGWVDASFTQIHDPQRPVFGLDLASEESLPVQGD